MTRQFLILTALLAMIGLPSIASAAPSDYNVNAGGSLSITVSGNAAAATAGRTIALGTGRFTFDSATGRVDKLKLFTSDGHVVASGSYFQATPSSTSNQMQIVVNSGVRQITFSFTAAPVTQNPGPGPGTVSAVPEPTAALLFAAGVGVVGFVGNRRRED